MYLLYALKETLILRINFVIVICSSAEVVECPGRNPCWISGWEKMDVDTGKYESLHDFCYWADK